MWKEFLIKRGLNEEIIKESKISYSYPWYRIPYEMEKIETIKGRWFDINGSQRPKTIPKYLWLRGKPDFPFNWNPVGWDTFIYICEGELDTILLRASLNNKDNVFGLPFGASTFKDEWASILKKSDVKVFSLLDNDSAGDKGTQNIANKIGRDVQRMIWPSDVIGFDVTDYAKTSSENLANRIGNLSSKTFKAVNEDLLVYKGNGSYLANDIELNKLKKQIPIHEVISKLTNIKIKSIPLGWQASCPLHEDKVPSLIIYKKTNSFYCFSCGAGGSSLDFIMKINSGMSLSKAADFLKNNYVRKEDNTI